ncbi:phospholipase D [Arthrobacter sp. Hiyo4]|nr:phospholipase D [Arthrobacter sp. Hiyo4]
MDRLKFGVVSCANWQAGYFSSYRHLAARGDLDAVLHLGDYLYEYGPGEYQARDVVVRPHEPPTK